MVRWSLLFQIIHLIQDVCFLSWKMKLIRKVSCNIFSVGKSEYDIRWQDAMVKDTLERATEPNLDLRAYLKDVYVHPVFKDGQMERPVVIDEEESNPLVPTKRNSNRDSEASSEAGASKT